MFKLLGGVFLYIAGLMHAWDFIGTGFVFMLLGVLVIRLKFNTDLFCYSKIMIKQMMMNDRGKNG
jgi:hypothetical protein